MKKYKMLRTIILAASSLLVIKGVYSQSPNTNNTKTMMAEVKSDNGPQLNFDNTTCDFGVIGYNSPGIHVYIVTNTGNQPLVIYNCIKGCGCTSVDWTKTPIKPGEKGVVKAAYNTKKIGHFSKGLDVYSNDPNNAKVNLRLKGEVMVLPGGEAPPVVTEDKPFNASEKPVVKW